jgi:hypothetical protein
MVNRIARLGWVTLLIGCQTASGVSGVWAGRVGGDGPNSVGIRFEVFDERGQLSGKTYLEDFVAKVYLEDSDFRGVSHGEEVTWILKTGGQFRGKFVNGSLVGTYTFPVDPDLPANYARFDQAIPIVLRKSSDNE